MSPSPLCACPHGALSGTVHGVGSVVPCPVSQARPADRCGLCQARQSHGRARSVCLDRLKVVRIIFVPHCPGSSAGQIFPKNWQCPLAATGGLRAVCACLGQKRAPLRGSTSPTLPTHPPPRRGRRGRVRIPGQHEGGGVHRTWSVHVIHQPPAQIRLLSVACRRPAVTRDARTPCFKLLH